MLSIGVLLVFSWAWLVIPLMIDLVNWGISGHFASYLAYGIPPVVVALTAMLVNSADRLWHFWPKCRPSFKAILLALCYSMTALVTVFLIHKLHTMHVIRFFGQDAAGSFSIIIIPTTWLFWVIAFVLGVSDIASICLKYARSLLPKKLGK